MMRSIPFTLAVLAAACGSSSPAGKISGKVTVEGGNPSKIAVEGIGPITTATVTDESGTFSLEGLKDGWYIVRATLATAEQPVKEAVVRVQNGAGESEPTLAFKVAAGKVSGKVVFSDSSAASGVGITLSGAVSRGTVTDSAGAFSFDALPSGAYLLAAEVLDSRERRQAVTFTLDSMMPSVTLPDLQFVVTGTVTGTVKDAAMMAASGVEVVAAGTGVRAVTDAAGAFELAGVPAGMRSIVATKTGAITQTAKSDVTVTKGTNAPLMLTLSAAVVPTGTVTGAVTFFSSQFANIITVSALGSTASTMVTAQGGFSLDVPAGEWDIVADAPLYPQLLVGHVTVKEGTSRALPPANMTVWRRFTEEPNLTGLSIALGAIQSETDWFSFNTTTGAQFNWVANQKTLSRRLFHVGPLATAALSRTGQHLAYAVPPGTYLINLTSGAQVAFMRDVGPAGIDFSTDESVFFLHDVAGSFVRYTIAGGVTKTFTAAQVFKLSRDKWIVVNSTTMEATLVTPTTDTVVFTAVNNVRASPVVHAFTDCIVAASTTCNIKVLPAGTTTAVTVAGGMYTLGIAVLPTGTPYESGGDFASFTSSAGQQKLIKVSDGTLISLPANTSRVDFNESATRLFYVSGTAGSQALREEALPPTGASTPVANLASTFAVEWVSPTRLILFDNAAGAGRRLDVKSGVSTADTNYVVDSGAFRFPMAHWARSSDMKRAALVADSTVYPLDITYPGMGVSVAGGFEGVSLPGRWGAISDNQVGGFKGTFVIDAVKNEIRNLTQFRVSGPATTFAHTYSATHASSGEQGYLTFATDQYVSFAEPGVFPVGLIPRPEGSWILGAFNPTTPTSRAAIAAFPFP